jgi:hypothetical protein
VNEEESKRLERRNTSAGSTNQEGKGGSYFQANGLEHFSFSPRTIISWGVLSGLIGLITASIVVYRSFGSQIDERIANNRELNRKLDKYDFEIDNLKSDSKELGSRVVDIERYINQRKK